MTQLHAPARWIARAATSFAALALVATPAAHAQFTNNGFTVNTQTSPPNAVWKGEWYRLQMSVPTSATNVVAVEFKDNGQLIYPDTNSANPPGPDIVPQNGVATVDWMPPSTGSHTLTAQVMSTPATAPVSITVNVTLIPCDQWNAGSAALPILGPLLGACIGHGMA